MVDACIGVNEEEIKTYLEYKFKEMIWEIEHNKKHHDTLIQEIGSLTVEMDKLNQKLNKSNEDNRKQRNEITKLNQDIEEKD